MNWLCGSIFRRHVVISWCEAHPEDHERMTAGGKIPYCPRFHWFRCTRCGEEWDELRAAYMAAY